MLNNIILLSSLSYVFSTEVYNLQFAAFECRQFLFVSKTSNIKTEPQGIRSVQIVNENVCYAMHLF